MLTTLIRIDKIPIELQWWKSSSF